MGHPEKRRSRDEIRKANELHPGKYLSRLEVDLLKRNIERLREFHPRDSLLMELLICTGGRPSEILAMQPSHLTEDGMLYLRGLKGSNSRWVPLPKPVFERLMKYAEDVGFEERIFPLTVTRLFQISQMFLPKGKSPRALRHTYALMTYEKTRDPRITQKMLGHRFLSTTEIYLDYQYSNKELREKAVMQWM